MESPDIANQMSEFLVSVIVNEKGRKTHQLVF